MQILLLEYNTMYMFCVLIQNVMYRIMVRIAARFVTVDQGGTAVTLYMDVSVCPDGQEKSVIKTSMNATSIHLYVVRIEFAKTSRALFPVLVVMVFYLLGTNARVSGIFIHLLL